MPISPYITKASKNTMFPIRFTSEKKKKTDSKKILIGPGKGASIYSQVLPLTLSALI